MARVVLDTNILVSALLSPGGPPFAVLGGILERRWELLASPEILEEYASVLGRDKFRLSAQEVAEALARLKSCAVAVFPSERVRACADPDDDKFLSAALAGAATHLVTGNLRHFPKGSYAGVLILSPRQFLDLAP